ncbi:MAG TPA: HPr family phosphocarrier protein [Candidatus Binataceae bacterium]|nr:HPr family phosphocarrier protein [Candidatus Binataceae bacterium]
MARIGGRFTSVEDTSIVGAMSVAEATVEIKNRLGLHLRAAMTLAQTAAKFKAKISIGRGKNQVNAKSVTELIMLGAGQGSKLKLHAEGDDATEAAAAIKSVFDERFGEE